MVDIFAPPTTAATGRSGFSRRGECLQFRFHQTARSVRQQAGKTFGRSVGAVRRGEGVVDVDVAEFGQLGRETGVVLLLFRMEAQVLHHDDAAGVDLRQGVLGDGADTVVGEGDLLPDGLGNGVHHLLERVFWSGPPLGRPKCERTTTLAPACESSVRVGANRSMRVVSVTTPSLAGTFRSARTRTVLPSNSKSSRVLKSLIRAVPFLGSGCLFRA